MTTQDLIVAIIGMCLLATVLMSPVACTMYSRSQITAAVQKGQNPIEAACAFQVDPNPTMCALVAATRTPR